MENSVPRSKRAWLLELKIEADGESLSIFAEDPTTHHYAAQMDKDLTFLHVTHPMGLSQT